MGLRLFEQNKDDVSTFISGLCFSTVQELQQFLPKNNDISNFSSNFSMGIYENFFIFSTFQETVTFAILFLVNNDRY